MAPGDEAANDRVRAAIDRELSLANRLFSLWDPASEVSRLNAHASTEPFAVSAETMAALELGRRASELTGGAFDVTVAPLVEAWGFGPAKRPPAVPAADDPRRAARARRLPAAVARRRGKDGRQGPARPGLRRLRARGRLGGRPGGPGARGPRLRRRAGRHRRRGLGPGPAARRLALAGRGRGAAAGQGGRGRRGGERRRRHLRRLPQRLDRRRRGGGAATSSTPGRASRSPTGSPPPPSSTRDGAWADALATGLLVLGPEAGRALAARERLAARLVLRQADGTYAEWSTPAFEALVVPAR